MDSSENSAGKSPKRELQGPRPTPLKLRKDSHKIKKPPVVPHQHHQLPPHHQTQPRSQPRPPIIIYTVSPKVIHANPSEFMSLVQRLTGPNSRSSSSSISSFPYQENTNNIGAISPAARFASIENTRITKGNIKKSQITNCDMEMVDHEEIEINREIERITSGVFPQGILSPNPASLQPISSNFFSPPSAGFFHDLSPELNNNRNYFEHNNYLPSSSNFISPRIILSPSTPSFDLFNNIFDHHREN
ncbi:protein MKS1-like [Solanum stenotomum]|uniref:protein MKS1-like n=1 Tax=Solanum stenotomum TaxID=172797 RepID=UPI0020D0E5DB|nr:protein MKS1-like [Solanum stenotomum]